jgi:hypothetical protein
LTVRSTLSASRVEHHVYLIATPIMTRPVTVLTERPHHGPVT